MATYSAEPNSNRTVLTGPGVRSMSMPRQVLYNLIELNADSLGDELKETLEELYALSAKGLAALVILVPKEERDAA